MIQNQSVSQVQSISLAIQGLIIGIVLVFPALMSMSFGKLHFGFSFLPIAVIYFWSRAASYTWSLLCMFLLGIFYDMASANTLGMWALTFLILYMVLDGAPHVKKGLGRNTIGFVLCVLLCVLVTVFVGWIVMGKLPQISVILLNAIATIIVFPILYWMYSIFTTLRRPSGTLGI